MSISIPDLIITIAYFSIPIQIVVSLCLHPRLTKKADNKIITLLVLFALFIFLCGAGHLIRCLDKADSNLFHIVNISTCIVSLVTAIYLVPFVPNLLGTIDHSLLVLDTSTRIIHSMYPESIRERLMGSMKMRSGKNLFFESSRSLNSKAEVEPLNDDANNEAKPSHKRRRASVNLMKERMREFVRKSRRPSLKPDFDVGANMKSVKNLSDPIADCIDSASVMFADIVGFTAWSSAHSPNDVFTLLEALFWEFDEIAKEMGVFKVATIGDGYLAATGLLNSRKDHAVVLAQFAEKCRQKMNEITKSLSSSMGPDTAELSMRFGVHSGPVTAGVLRGHKSRFELFGDTVNTASRMESTGAPDRVQVSQETADLLIVGGKEDWLVAREDPVNAKGKGRLQTYWAVVDLSEDEATDDSVNLGGTSTISLDTSETVSTTTQEKNNDDFSINSIV